MTKLSKILAWTLGAAIAGGGGLVAYRLVSSSQAGTLSYVTQPARKQRIVATVTATGTLQPRHSVLVSSQVSGRIAELGADFNSVVKKGDVLARLDTRLFDSDVARAAAALAAARANLAKAEASLGDLRKQATRAQDLRGRELIADADADTAAAAAHASAAARTAAVADVEEAKAALQQSQVNLAFTTIVSPIDGVVLSRDVNVGQTVAASLSAPTLFTLAEDLRQMEIHTSVAEADVGTLEVDMAVTFTVDAFPGRRFTGKVTQIRNAPVTVQNVVTYDAVVQAENQDLKLRPGMTANAAFVVADHKDVLAVPATALRYTPAGAAPAGGRKAAANGTRTVWVLEGATPRRVEVTVGVSDGRFTEVTAVTDGGLVEGAAVVTSRTGETNAPTASQSPSQGAPGQRRGAGLGL